jgi:hypothetical protein
MRHQFRSNTPNKSCTGAAEPEFSWKPMSDGGPVNSSVGRPNNGILCDAHEVLKNIARGYSLINFSLSHYQQASTDQQANIASIIHQGFIAGDALYITGYEYNGIGEDQVRQNLALVRDTLKRLDVDEGFVGIDGKPVKRRSFCVINEFNCPEIQFSYISKRVGVCDGDPESLLKGLEVLRAYPQLVCAIEQNNMLMNNVIDVVMGILRHNLNIPEQQPAPDGIVCLVGSLLWRWSRGLYPPVFHYVKQMSDESKTSIVYLYNLEDNKAFQAVPYGESEEVYINDIRKYKPEDLSRDGPFADVFDTLIERANYK